MYPLLCSLGVDMWHLIAWMLVIPGVPIPENGVVINKRWVVQHVESHSSGKKCEERKELYAKHNPDSFLTCVKEV